MIHVRLMVKVKQDIRSTSKKRHQCEGMIHVCFGMFW